MKTELPLIVAALMALGIGWSWRPGATRPFSARPAAFMAAWLAVFLLPYVAFGPSSFLWMDDEGDLLLPAHYYIANLHGPGLYSHLLASGDDAYASFIVGGELVSAERMLLGVLPIWLAVAVHKALTCGFALGGTYLVARRMGKCSPALALALAGLGSVYFKRMVMVTYGTGMTLALVPVAVYLLVGRLGRPHYWLGVAAMAAAAVLWSNPYQGAPSMAVAVLGTMVMLRRYAFRPLAGIAVVFAALALNWSESIYGMLQLAHASHVGSVSIAQSGGIAALVQAFDEWRFILSGVAWPLGVQVAAAVTALALWARGDLPRVVTGLCLPVLVLAAIYAFPWSALNLGVVRNATWGYLLYSTAPLAALALARAGTVWEARLSAARATWPTLALTMLAVFLVSWYSARQITILLHNSGQAHYRIANLAQPEWFTGEPYRTVSLRGTYLQPEPNVLPGVYGLPAFDTWLNMMDLRHAHYWLDGIMRGPDKDTRLIFNWGSYRDGAYHLGETASVELLAAANVGYLVSGVPVDHPRLTLLDGPAVPPDLAKPRGHAERWLAYYGARVRRIFELGKMYVYRVEGAAPRVYAAQGVVSVPDGASISEFLRVVEREAPGRVAVVRRSDSAALAAAGRSLTVLNFELVPDGFDIRVQAPEGGVVMVNAVASRQFHAWADGQPIPVVEASGVQTALAVPAGTQRVMLCYQRRELFLDRAGNCRP